ncbi:putative transcription factor C2H2 family [Helianthus annuus]|nr:putative transcription factor C2H2 family [Helianthus annuus]
MDPQSVWANQEPTSYSYFQNQTPYQHTLIFNTSDSLIMQQFDDTFFTMQDFEEILTSQDQLDESLMMQELYETLNMQQLDQTLTMQDLDETLTMQELEEIFGVAAGTSGSGLSEEEISKHLYVYTAQGKMSQVDPCCICLGDHEKKEKMGRLECGHWFHAECIKCWLLSKNVCPLCRSTALTV